MTSSSTTTTTVVEAALRRRLKRVSWQTWFRRSFTIRNIFFFVFTFVIPSAIAVSWISIWSEEWYGTNIKEFDRCWNMLHGSDNDRDVETSMECFAARHLNIHSPEAEIPLKLTGRLKLIHDVEQLDYLNKRGMLKPMFSPSITVYMKLIQRIEKGKAPASFPVNTTPSEVDPILWKSIFSKSVFMSPSSAKLPHPMINPYMNSTIIQNGYAKNSLGTSHITENKHTTHPVNSVAAQLCRDQDGFAVVDNFLTNEALTHMRKYLEESTIWYHMHHAGEYLEARLDDGLASPILAQLSNEIRNAFPKILSRHKLTQAFARKYDNSNGVSGPSAKPGHGARLRAEVGAVVVRIWLTQDNALFVPNLLPKDINFNNDTNDETRQSSSGLLLFNREVSSDWTADMYTNNSYLNVRNDHVRHSSIMKIPYKANRLIMFNANLLHKTERKLHFRVGYSNRRIGLTLVYGRHCSENLLNKGRNI